jgi:hypothetical protein
MTHTHTVDARFLEQERYDPITGDKIIQGDTIVICAECKSAFLLESWQYLGSEHCGQTRTLDKIPQVGSLSINRDQTKMGEPLYFYKSNYFPYQKQPYQESDEALLREAQDFFHKRIPVSQVQEPLSNAKSNYFSSRGLAAGFGVAGLIAQIAILFSNYPIDDKVGLTLIVLLFGGGLGFSMFQLVSSNAKECIYSINERGISLFAEKSLYKYFLSVYKIQSVGLYFLDHEVSLRIKTSQKTWAFDFEVVSEANRSAVLYAVGHWLEFAHVRLEVVLQKGSDEAVLREAESLRRRFYDQVSLREELIV